ncbi:hypothetical protein Tco_0480789 [Tanacetum coccineum]
MVDHSQKWHDETTSRNVESNSSSDGLAALVNTLDTLSRDMKKLKEIVYAIQVKCQVCEGHHPDKNCPLNEELKGIEEVKYGEYGNPFLESKVVTLSKEAETKTDKNEDCKGIFTNNGTPLYTSFYYSPKEIKYFLANSGFLDDDESKNVTSISDEEFKQTTTHYIELYVPLIHFPIRLKQHADEALIHKTMESLKKIKLNRPFLKEIRKSDEYPKYMKDLVTNKPLTMENEDIRMNHRCSALFLNQLPPKEKDPRSFILPCSIGRLDFNNALADLGASISIMPFLCTNSIERSIDVEEECLSLDDNQLHDELKYGAYNTIGESHWCEHVFQEHKKGWENTIMEDWEDPEKCRETMTRAIIEAMVNKLPKEWFSRVSKDKDDLEGIIDYLEPTLYDGFINPDDEAYKQRRNKLLGMPYTEPPPILKEAEIIRYNLGAGEVFTKTKILNIKEFPRTTPNTTDIRAKIINRNNSS